MGSRKGAGDKGRGITKRALRMEKGWRVMQAFGCDLTCVLMFHVEHRKNTQLYRKVFRSELLYSPKCFTWNISQLNTEKIFTLPAARQIISRDPIFEKFFPQNVSRGTIYYPSLSVMKAASASYAREALPFADLSHGPG